MVFTAIVNDFEPIKDGQNTHGADFVIFTDTPHKSTVWRQLSATNLFTDSRRNARWHKANSLIQFPNYEYTIWLDGSMEMKTNALWLVDNYMQDYDIAVFKHPLRDCLYDEAQVVVSKGKECRSILDRQLDRYRNEGYPSHNGLGETKCVIRRNTPQVKYFEMLWNHELVNFSKRDQCSLNYCVWKSGIRINYLPVQIENHEAIYPNFNYIKHGQ